MNKRETTVFWCFVFFGQINPLPLFILCVLLSLIQILKEKKESVHEEKIKLLLFGVVSLDPYRCMIYPLG